MSLPRSHYYTKVHTRSGHSAVFPPVENHRLLVTRQSGFENQLFGNFLAMIAAQHLETLEPAGCCNLSHRGKGVLGPMGSRA